MSLFKTAKLENRCFPLSSLPLVFIILCVLGCAKADLSSDKLVLLAFANSIHHGSKLNWNSSISICSTWVGVSCSPDQNHVLSLRLPGIGLLGSIPENILGQLDHLRVLSLRSNCLTGNLPSDIFSLASLKFLFLQHNNFSGKIPASVPLSLNSLDLSYNLLTGGIPTGLLHISQLSVLNLENNLLSGPIPDLKLPRLKHLNLSNNNLNGSIPSCLQNFSNFSFLGNSHLCGHPLSKCSTILPSPSPFYLVVTPPPTVPENQENNLRRKINAGFIAAIAAGGLAVFVLLVVVLFVCFTRKTDRGGGDGDSKEMGPGGGRGAKPKEDYSSGVQAAERNKLVFFKECTYNFDLEDLLRASAEVLGKGSYATAYKASLEDGTTVVVKRLKEVVAGKKEFEQQMELIGKVGQHPNLNPLRAYYYSKDEKLLVYDYIPTGSFSAHLHGASGTGVLLDWDSRVKIILGAAYGIAHIHSEGGGKLAHGNIKSTNILLDQDLKPVVSDYGLTVLANLPANTSRIVVGYCAPETIETRKITQKSDIYSFGVLLLEMLTGKAPLQSHGQDDVADLLRWVQSVVREEWTAEVFDKELMRSQHTEEEMVQMLQVAMACVVKSPDQRPRMEEVIRKIEEIRQFVSESKPSSEDKHRDSDDRTP